MSVTFKEIMDFKKDHNTIVFNEIKKNIGQLLPFIGAGLTASFYGTWPSAIRSLGKSLGVDYRNQLDRMLSSGEYLDAAQLLEDALGKGNLRENMIAHFSASKLASNWSSVQKEAVYLLPLLFKKCPIVTTNFDEALEEVYLAHHVNLHVLKPTDSELVSTAKKHLNTACVFKLHGTVTGDMMAYDELVFTKSQYENHYGPTDQASKAFAKRFPISYADKYPVYPVVGTLREFASARSLFFLGCSLEKDRTIEILRQASATDGSNFAIVSCKPGEQDRRKRELDDLNVRAILFEDGKYESVRIILEALLQELYPKEYDNLAIKLSALHTRTALNPYKYDSKMTPLIGRNNEMEQLIDFVKSKKDPFLWWALTGPGGSGKSRLALELKTTIENAYEYRNWRCRKLEAKDYGRLSEYFKPSVHDTLIIADYVQAHVHELGACMARATADMRTGRLRLLLVERDGLALNQTRNGSRQIVGVDWQRQLFDYAQPRYVKKIKDACWKTEFLRLGPPTPDDLKEIIVRFSSRLHDEGMAKRDVPNEAECGSLLECLKKIDPGLCRPLYLLFLTGTFMNGDDPTAWERERILDHTIEAERIRLDERIREVMYPVYGSDYWKGIGILLTSCLDVYRLTTALLGKPASVIEDHCQQDWNVLSSKAAKAEYADAKELLAEIGLIHNDDLIPMEPDIMGEYFVYNWLCNEAKEGRRRSFLTVVWSHELESAIFFDRLYTDFGYLLHKNPKHWMMLLPPVDESTGIQKPVLRAMLLVNITMRCRDADIARTAVDRLVKLQRRFNNDSDVALALAQGLFNLSNWQDATEAESTLEKLEHLLKAGHQKDARIALLFAQGLFNLSNKQSAQTIPVGIVDRIKALRKNGFEKDSKITLALSRGLANLTFGQSLSETISIIDQIERLRNEGFQDDRNIALALARALFNLSYEALYNPSYKQDITTATRAITKIEPLQKAFRKDQEIALLLAKGYVNLTSKQDANTAKGTVSKIQELLCKDFNNDPQMTLALGRALANLLYKQDATEAETTVWQIGELQKKFDNEYDIALLRAKGLLALAIKHDISASTERKVVSDLRSLEQDFPQIVEEALADNNK